MRFASIFITLLFTLSNILSICISKSINDEQNINIESVEISDMDLLLKEYSQKIIDGTAELDIYQEVCSHTIFDKDYENTLAIALLGLQSIGWSEHYSYHKDYLTNHQHQSENWTIASLLYYAGLSYAHLGNDNKAIEYFRCCLEAFCFVGDRLHITMRNRIQVGYAIYCLSVKIEDTETADYYRDQFINDEQYKCVYANTIEQIGESTDSGDIESINSRSITVFYQWLLDENVNTEWLYE